MVRAGWLERGPGPGRPPRRGAVRPGELARRRSTSWPASCGASTARTAARRSTAAPTAGRARGASTTPRASSIGSSTAWAATSAVEHTYSNGALTVILPHVVGSSASYLDRATAWSVLARHTELFVCFGGIPLKNTQVQPGRRAPPPGARPPAPLRGRAGREFVLVSPLRDDLPELAGAEWHPLAPGTDVALMLGARPHADRRGPARPRLPRPLLRRASTASSATSWGDDDGQAEDAGVGGSASRGLPAGDDPRAGAADGGAAHADHRELVAPARRARRAGAVAGA